MNSHTATDRAGEMGERTRSVLTIIHTHEAGTLIEGTARGDGSAAVLKEQRWRWSRNLGAWYVPQSRDRRPKHHVIRPTVAALEAAGFTVTIELDERTRSAAEVDAARTERANDRAAALDAKADRKAADADAAWSKHLHDVDRLPEGGEPIKVGHHSEGRHRKALDRAWSSMGKSVEANEAAEEAERRAKIAASANGARHNPVTVANRIEKLQADERRMQRRITEQTYSYEHGYQDATPEKQAARAEALAPHLAELRDQIEFWESVRAEQIASGQATDYGRHNVAKGDAVRVRGTWYVVARCNAKTVAVETQYSWTDKTPWHEVQDHRTSAQLEEARAKKAAAEVA
ncbi:DUF3560 domain-containing protein [Pseudoclavibacter terrae]|nr:DUF3560 domain-containing protein [Pseudoclavibacter terrae]